MGGQNNKPVGNAAALREALVELTDKVLDYLYKGLIQLPLPIEEANAKARAALSAPARNCDVYKTPEDCMRAFESYVREHGKLGFMNPFTEVVKWLFAPAEERKGDGDENK